MAVRQGVAPKCPNMRNEATALLFGGLSANRGIRLKLLKAIARLEGKTPDDFH